MPAKGTKSTKTTKPKVARSNVAKSSSKTGLLSKKIKFNWKIAAVIGVVLVAALGYLFVRLSQAGGSTIPPQRFSVTAGSRHTKADGSQKLVGPTMAKTNPSISSGEALYPSTTTVPTTYKVLSLTRMQML